MQDTFSTERLQLGSLHSGHTAFIKQLLNTEGWIRFIGERNIHSEEDALTYIYKILANPHVKYWVVQLKETNAAIGIVTFIQRDYLDHPDIGFAFLPQFAGKGYAFEASKEVLNALLKSTATMYATTVPENSSSIQLLEKLGLQVEKEIEVENEKLFLYKIAAS
jgi:ribosomal-protein-alanine N-acetyltransferase